MSTNFSSYLLTSIILFSELVHGSVPEPKHVTVSSVNLGAVLLWDPVTSEDNVTYTAEFARAYNENRYIQVCQNIRDTKCDFTGNISAFGIFHFRVKSVRQGNASQWVYVKAFAADLHTRIGPPSDVKLKSRSGLLGINISDPLMKIKDKTLHNTFDNILYLVSYWKNMSREEVSFIPTSKPEFVLENLEPGTEYCVTVRMYRAGLNMNSKPSEPQCAFTSPEPVSKGTLQLSRNVGMV
ncbi:interleukin-10 receptor subunit beta-like [Huso huso]|uniref:Interleukin-10 receptor subunit beta-like n=1 Tax=Huso huso TaxID=61971 RepID=A0ABR0ZM06_HUSHU